MTGSRKKPDIIPNNRNKQFIIRFVRGILIVIVVLASLSFYSGCENRNKTTPFVVIYTSNLQGNALPGLVEQVSAHQPAHHFSQTLEIINRVKKGDKKSAILLDSGNSLVGFDDFSSMFNGDPMIELMNIAGYDGVLIADNPNVDVIKLPDAPPFLKAVGVPGKSPCIVKNIGNIKIGIFCIVEIGDGEEKETEKWKKNSSKSTFCPDFQVLNKAVAEKKADFNILLCRTNFMEKLTAEVKGIDLIIPGRFHDELKSREITTINGVAVAPYVDSRFNIGKIDIEGDDKFKCRIIPTGGADERPSQEVMKVLRPYIEKFRKKYPDNYSTVISSVVAYGTDDMIHRLDSPGDSPTANFITDVIRKATGAEIAIVNHLAFRKNLKGTISTDRIREILPFENELVTIDLTGEQIESILKSNAKEGKTFYQVSGIVVGVGNEEGGNISAKEMRKAGKQEKDPASQSGVIISYNGKPIEKDKTYRVVTIDYLVNSDKEKYSTFREAKNRKFTGMIINIVLFDYLKENPYITAPAERMIIDDVLSIQKLISSTKTPEILEVGGYELRGSVTINNDNDIYLKNRKSFLKVIPDAQKKFAWNLFTAVMLFRDGKIDKSKKAFENLLKERPDSRPLQKITASFPEKTLPGEAISGRVLQRTFRGDFRRTGRSEYAGATRGKIAWKFRTHHSIQSSPVIGHGGVIFCAAGDGHLYAITPEGAKKWSIRLGKVLLASPTVTDRGVIYTGADNGVIYAVSHTGKILWKYKTDGWIKSTVAIGRDGTIYFGSDDKHLYALTPAGKLKWKLKMGHEVFSSPAIGKDGDIFLGCLDRNIYCVSPDGKVKWKYPTKGKIYSTPAIADDGTVYVGSDDSFIYALTPAGKLKWKYKTGGFVPSSPAVGKDGAVYIGSEDNNLYALSPDGKLRWKFKTDYEIFGSPAIDREGNIFFGSDDTYFYALTPGGKMMWKVKAAKYIESSPAIADNGTIYFGADDGFVYAVK
ncbi:MAG: PQQ-binding-like beta-propeller repeat protein [Candidatus Eremiobacteraeota bacterium]|nr:PQQ-binding-like beta-propeller repeat protein [Candidatus Eremiobacteraeota bacterium]